MRELKNVIERAMILSTSDEIHSNHLPQEIVGDNEAKNTSLSDPFTAWLHALPAGSLSLEQLTERIERHLVHRALDMAQHNRTRAAQTLGLAKVDQLRYLMRKHHID